MDPFRPVQIRYMLPKPPRLRRWRGRWHVIFIDPLTGRERRVSCGDRNHTEAREVLAHYRRQSQEQQVEVFRLGGMFDYERRLVDALGQYLKEVDQREGIRYRSQSREGLSANSARQIRQIVTDFTAWCGPVLTTGRLDAPTLQRYFRELADMRSSARVNVYRRTLRAALGWLSQLRPRVFPDFESLKPAFRQAHVEPRRAVALTPEELRIFHDALPPDQQLAFRFLALTGCRLGEMEDAELQGERLLFTAAKTGRHRLLPLVGAPEVTVAPKLLKELRRRMPRVWERKAWERAGPIRPQMLRRNFTSYAASLGVPAMVCALWQGHSVQVAERYYHQQVLTRRKARSIEFAMGL